VAVAFPEVTESEPEAADPVTGDREEAEEEVVLVQHQRIDVRPESR
jgi:hypothetical protein